MKRGREANMVNRGVRENLSEAERANTRRYAIVIDWSHDDQLFLVSIPDFPGAHTHGRTRAEAAEMGEEVIALLLDGETNPPAARFTAVDYPVRPEADVHEAPPAWRPDNDGHSPAARVSNSTGRHPLPLMVEPSLGRALHDRERTKNERPHP